MVNGVSASERAGKIIINHEWKFRAFTKAANFSPWPKDCLRHSYGSYHLAKFQHSGQTAEFMGHENPDMLYKHYRDVIKEQGDIDAFWDFVPSQAGAVAGQDIPSTQ